MIYLVSGEQKLFETSEYKSISIEESLQLLNSCEILQYDSETGGRDARLCDILCIQFGNKEKDFQIVVDTTSIDINLYKEVLAGKYDIRKGEEWKDDLTNHRMIVKNIEVFEKVIPIFVSLSKQYSCEDIEDIFNYCRNKNNTFNFAAIQRIRLLVNILHSNKPQE